MTAVRKAMCLVEWLAVYQSSHLRRAIGNASEVQAESKKDFEAHYPLGRLLVKNCSLDEVHYARQTDASATASLRYSPSSCCESQ
jgi:hypothetical protein